MEDKAFREWLAQKSWTQAVRYSRTVIWLMLPASLALDIPLVANETLATVAGAWLVAWQAAVVLTCIAMMLIEKLAPRVRGREIPLYVFCGVFMLLTMWAGVRAQLIGGGGLIVYAAGSTFIAAVICTPRLVRRPMYALSLVGLALPVWLQTGDIEKMFASLVLPFCVVVLCIELDRFTYSQNRALYTEKVRADSVLYNVLPVPIADELKATGQLKAVRHENMGVLFADIAGFTSFSRSLPPNALVLVLNEIFSSFDALVDKHAVEKIKTIGDAYMVVSEGRIGSLGQLALDMNVALQRYNRINGTQLGIRIGIHAGPTVAGVIGLKRFLYDVWGDTVNVASRMESTGAAGAIHVSENVYRQTRGQFEFRPCEALDIKGGGPVSTWWLLGPAAVAGGAPDDTPTSSGRHEALFDPAALP